LYGLEAWRAVVGILSTDFVAPLIKKIRVEHPSNFVQWLESNIIPEEQSKSSLESALESALKSALESALESAVESALESALKSTLEPYLRSLRMKKSLRSQP
jgi:hypothetical protein